MGLRSETRTRGKKKVSRFVNYNQACVGNARGGADRARQPFFTRILSVDCIFFLFQKLGKFLGSRTFQEAACRGSKTRGNLKSAAIKTKSVMLPVCEGLVVGSQDSVLWVIIQFARNVA